MNRHASSRLPLLLAAAALGLSILGAVMADTHDPVAVDPDAKLADGHQLATFALG